MEEYNKMTMIGKLTWFPIFVMTMIVVMPILIIVFGISIVLPKAFEKPVEFIIIGTKHYLYKKEKQHE